MMPLFRIISVPQRVSKFSIAQQLGPAPASTSNRFEQLIHKGIKQALAHVTNNSAYSGTDGTITSPRNRKRYLLDRPRKQ